MTRAETMASALREAYSTEPIPPLDDIASDDVDMAYAIQEINTQYWISKGRTLVGRKIGLTSIAVQKQLGVDQPDFGALFNDMGIEDGGVLSPSVLLQPKVEAEIALVLGADLDIVDCTASQVAAAVEYAVASLEIVDSRIEGWQIRFADTVADNGSSAKFVLGKEKKTLENLDLYSCGMVLEVDGVVTSLGAGAACLGHPLNAAAWLASTLSQRGAPLKEGDILLTGALGPMVSLTPGSNIKSQIGGLGSCSFEYRDNG